MHRSSKTSSAHKKPPNSARIVTPSARMRSEGYSTSSVCLSVSQLASFPGLPRGEGRPGTHS